MSDMERDSRVEAMRSALAEQFGQFPTWFSYEDARELLIIFDRQQQSLLDRGAPDCEVSHGA